MPFTACPLCGYPDPPKRSTPSCDRIQITRTGGVLRCTLAVDHEGDCVLAPDVPQRPEALERP